MNHRGFDCTVGFLLLLFFALPAPARAIVPCEPSPAVSAAVVFGGSESQIQLALRTGGDLSYTATVLNGDPLNKQPFTVQVSVAGDYVSGALPANFLQVEAAPVVAPGKTWALTRALTIPPGLTRTCVTVRVLHNNPECGERDLRDFRTLASSTKCVTTDPIVCLGGVSTCSWLPSTGPPRVTHEICWDHVPTQAEALAWTQVNCN